MLPGKYHPEDDHIHVFPQDYPLPAPKPQFVRVSDWPQTQIIQRNRKPLSGFSPAGENLSETPEVSRPEPRTVENPFQQRLQQSRQEDRLGKVATGLTEEASIVLSESKKELRDQDVGDKKLADRSDTNQAMRMWLE